MLTTTDQCVSADKPSVRSVQMPIRIYSVNQNCYCRLLDGPAGTRFLLYISWTRELINSESPRHTGGEQIIGHNVKAACTYQERALTTVLIITHMVA